MSTPSFRLLVLLSALGAAAAGCGSSDDAVCSPATCDSAGATCGDLADGCGGVLDCGATCPAGQTCGGGGTPNVCAVPPPPCQPTTCEAQKKSCGTTPDGCGGALDCGSCPAGQTCGGGGTPNVCAAPPANGNVRWSFVQSTPGPEVAFGAGVDRDGNRYLLGASIDEVGPSHTLRLEKHSRDGKALWKKEWAYRGDPWRPFRLAVTPLGNVFIAFSVQCPDQSSCTERGIDFGGGNIDHTALVKLGADGRWVWDRDLAANDVGDLTTDDQGSALVWRQPFGAASLQKYGFDGALLYDVAPGQLAAATLDAAGNALAVTVAMDGTGALTLTKLGGDGKTRWALPLSGAGWYARIGATEKGTAAILALRSGDVTFGESKVNHGGMVLYTVEADGKPRWAVGYEYGFHILAVDRTGRAFVGGQSGSCGETTVDAVLLDGSSLWRRTLPNPDPRACWSTYPAAATYGADHEPFLGIVFNGTVSFGDDTYVSRGQDVAGVELSP